MIVDPNFNAAMLQTRFAYRSKLFDGIKKRFLDDYLASLRERQVATKRQKSVTHPSVRDIVLVHEDAPRSTWPLGLIKELHPGADGEVRAATIRLNGKETNRAIYQLYPLEVNHPTEDAIEETTAEEDLPDADDDLDATLPYSDGTSLQQRRPAWSKCREFLRRVASMS